MVAEKLLQFSLRLKRVGIKSLSVFSISRNGNMFFNWVYKIFCDEEYNRLPNGNSLHAQDEISNLSDEYQLSILDYNLTWMGAPKKRTSKKTKWLRHQRKFIKNREDIETCFVCGNAKLINHLCGTCFNRIQQTTKRS